MYTFPESEDPFLIRTDFTDDLKWESLVSMIDKPARIENEFVMFESQGPTEMIDEFKANVTCVDDKQFVGMSINRLVSMYPIERNHMFFFVADTKTLSHPELPVIAVNLSEEVGQTFRVIPSEMWGVENNLSICNMEFNEFKGAIDPDGIFRGFHDV